MRKNVFGRQFKRDTNERQSLFKSLISSLILTGRIKTTEEKAKAIKGDIDKIITKAKKGEIARRILQGYVLKDAVKKAISEIAPRFAKRQGGYTRITRIGRRLSDNASMVVIEWVEDTNSESRIQNSELEKPKKIEGQKEENKLGEKPEEKPNRRSRKNKEENKDKK